MDYLRHGTSGAKSIPISAMMGCKYRQRTGACSCDNPPIGCMEPEDRPSRSEKASTQPAQPSTRIVAASAAPPPLPTQFPVFGSDKQVPALGWRCSGQEDATAAVAAGMRFIDACGCENIEAALSSAGSGTLLATTLPPLNELQVETAKAAAEAAGSRMGRPCSDLLIYLEWPESLKIDECSAASWQSVSEQLKGHVGILAIAFSSAQMASDLLRHLQVNCPGAMPGAAIFPTSADKPHRALIGACRRLSVLPLATAPLVPKAADGAAADLPSTSQCLSWSAARGVPAMVSCEDARIAGVEPVSLISTLSAPLAPLNADERARLNALG